MEKSWVGTWRPHPRRGPILAEFSTPGPKYGLPGTTGHPGHDPTMARAPAYSFRGTKCPSAETCSPGPRYFIDSSITKTGKYVSPSAHVMGRYKTKSDITPGPSDYTTEPANKHVYHTAPVRSLMSRPKDIKGFQTPGPAAYTLPRILGPRTAYTHAEPCYSMRWKSQYQSCFQDLAKYTMGLKTEPVDKGIGPGPAEYSPGKLSVTKTRDPAFSFGIRHSVYKASLIPETHPD
ncbi:PREDICTED: outer dense fiber protein 3-like [Sturnus vulgaris]|uniref:outer dense fiber protein 3-like n=1 Tax=Sturnus vulgaris TaxID=9172 RepID=UPI000719EE34|nr:PREDICTED: outer dense fiber protein 3-like [Sturnus vulgaris]